MPPQVSTVRRESAALPGFEPRSGRELVAATKPFAQEVRAKSWWYVWSTLVILLRVLTVAALAAFRSRESAAAPTGLVSAHGAVIALQ